MQPLSALRNDGRFLHLVPDDKFIDAAFAVLEEAMPGAHDYVFVGTHPMRYVHSFRPIGLGLGNALSPSFLATLPSYRAVFVHFLSDAARLIVASAPPQTRFIWLGWGADYYHLICPRDQLYLPMTRMLVRSPALRSLKFLDAIVRGLKKLPTIMAPRQAGQWLDTYIDLDRLGRGGSQEQALLERFSGISTPIHEDFLEIKARNPGLGGSYVDWNYWSEGLSGGTGIGPVLETNILLGNSATPENNHLEAFEILREHLPGKFHLICPLSYGDRRYGDAVERRGRHLFGGRFTALREYLPADRYRKIIASCSIVVMNHIRQQGLGNVLIALNSGANVFLNPASPVISALSRMGIRTSTIDDLPAHLQEVDDRNQFGRQALDLTRSRIEAHFGRDAILQRTRDLLQKLQRTKTV